MLRTINLQTFPRDDAAFRAHVEVARDRIGEWSRAGIEAEIRKAYPAAVVHPASEFARLELETTTWYVYRDGHVETAIPAEDWWQNQALPTTVVSADGWYVDANDAAADLFGVSREHILGAAAGSFTRHEDSDELMRRLFALLAQTGSMHSTAIVSRPDGEDIRVEFHVRRDTAPDRYVTVMRRI